MVPSTMFSSQSSQSPSPSSDFSSPSALDASTFSSLPLSFNNELSTVNFLPVSPFPVYAELRRATLTDHSQLIENAITLSPVLATLTSRVKHNPFVYHSYRKHPRWGYTLQPGISSFRNLTTLYSLLVYPEASRKATISFRIRTSEKRAPNSRIRTYRKTRGWVGGLIVKQTPGEGRLSRATSRNEGSLLLSDKDTCSEEHRDEGPLRTADRASVFLPTFKPSNLQTFQRCSSTTHCPLLTAP
jgi:hypothetical protein